MKVKLLKKVRKQYSIVYYPEGILYDRCIFHKKDYVVHKKWRSFWEIKGYSTLQEAIDSILYEVRCKYGNKSRKYGKPNYGGVKVWWNYEN